MGILQNCKAYATGINLRLESKRQGHGSHNINTLIEAGRRLTSLELVVFTIVFRSILERVVAPWSLHVQSDSMEPWITEARFAQHQMSVRGLKSLFRWTRALHRICFLLRQHLHPSAITCFWKL